MTHHGDADWLVPDWSVPPGEDFYQHVNGPWLKAREIPDDAGSIDAFREAEVVAEAVIRELLESAGRDLSGAVGLAADFYAAGVDLECRNRDKRAPIQPLLEAISKVGDAVDLLRLLPGLHRSGVFALWRPEVAASEADGTRHALWLLPGTLGLGHAEYYSHGTDTVTERMRAYEQYVAAQLRNAGLPSRLAAAQAPAVLSIECELAWAHCSAIDSASRHRGQRVTVPMLESWSQDFDMNDYLAHLGSPPVTCVEVPDQNGLRAALEVLVGRSGEALRAYLYFMLVHHFRDSIHSDAYQAHLEFHGCRRRGQLRSPSLRGRVMSVLGTDIGDVLASIYAREVDEVTTTAVASMTTDIIEETRISVRTRAWLTPASQQSALGKLDSIRVQIAPTIGEPDLVAAPLTETTFAGIRQEIAQRRMDLHLSRLRTPVRREAPWRSGYLVNASYHPSTNEITVPAALTHPPFFAASGDQAANYGSLGFVIAHEVVHALDDWVAHLAADSPLEELWAETARSHPHADVGELVAQFDEYKVDETAHVDGRITLRENLADLSGIALAARALSRRMLRDGLPDHLGSQRTCFYAYARLMRGKARPQVSSERAQTDTHSPYEWRVRGPVSNLESFQVAFNLPDESPALRARSRRIEIW